MELIVFLSCGAVAGLVAFVRDRKRTDELEDKIREIRAVLAAAFPYRLPTHADADLVALLAPIDMSSAAQDGMTPLGDLILEAPGRQPMSIMRAFTDAGTTVLYVSAYPQHPGKLYLLLESYARDAEYITHVGNPVRAQAPFSHHQTVSRDLPLREILARHREFVRASHLIARGALAPTASLDELMRELRANHALFVRWRESLSPEELLEVDLKTVLGEQYAVHGPGWKRRLALRLPQATLRKKR
ncbi:MAG: hypothetical protein M4D80_20845 [Myxococcota bacterium]|nr:hypothetical protein [Deltaproteobacteria bacterium]MDQ3337617.1 hypothetical protein [Myxococcota bacterium]